MKRHVSISCFLMLAIVAAIGSLRAAETPTDSSGRSAATSDAAPAKADKSDNSEDDATSASADSENASSHDADQSNADKKEKETDKSDSDNGKADEGKTADKKPEKKKVRKTATVEEKRLKVDVTIDGVFVADRMAEVALRPESWSQFEIVDIVDHGSEVHEGEVLVRFDEEKINKAIEKLDLELHLNENAIMRAEQELEPLEKNLALSYAEAERAHKMAEEDRERYVKSDRPMIVKSVEFMVRRAQYALDYQQDELDQLEKMYEADDLTEETEEIVLRRQRDAVQLAAFDLESAQKRRKDVLEVLLPRYDIQIEEDLDRTALQLVEAKTASSLDLIRARYELEKLKQARAKSLNEHAKLLTDRGLMEIKAPTDGFVYFGRCVRGQWPETATLVNKLRPFSMASPKSVLMTIVESRPLHVVATVGEAKRPEVHDGQSARIVPPLEGSDRIDGRVESISAVPISPGKFAVNVEPDQNQLPEWIVAGMSCKVKINVYDKSDALMIPKKAVHTDEYDDELQYVWIVDPDDEKAKPKRRDVKIGKRHGDEVEVVSGLEVGDVMSLEDEDKKADKD